MKEPRPEEIVTDEEIDRVHGSANFGPTLTPREVLNEALLKCACGYSNGGTASAILAEHGLTVDVRRRGQKALTLRGRKYLWSVYGPLQPGRKRWWVVEEYRHWPGLGKTCWGRLSFMSDKWEDMHGVAKELDKVSDFPHRVNDWDLAEVYE